MTLPDHDTRVTYPAGALTTSATVLHTETLADGRVAILLDATSCHPVDAGWPDQGPDRAVLRPTSQEDAPAVAVVDCVVGATDGSTLYLGRDIPVSKGTPGWTFVVVHIVEAGSTPEGDAHAGIHLMVGHGGCEGETSAASIGCTVATTHTPSSRSDRSSRA